jgi:SAM-dependent methyltransferase
MVKDYEMEIDFSDRNDAHAIMVEMVGTDKRVVDFGCWTGFVARELKRRGCYVTGIEVDPRAAEVARSVCDRVIEADLDTIDLRESLEGEKYDVGLFGDVVEHLKDPARLLRQMREMLSPGGYIVVSVPNIAHAGVRLMLLQGRFKYEDTGILDDTHLKYYTRQSIGDLLEACGYIVDVMNWTENRVSEEELRQALDPLGLANLEKVVEAFSTWEAVAFQYLIKAIPASEEGYVQRLSEEKVQAERRLKMLQAELEESLAGRTELEDELQEAKHYIQTIKDQIDKKDAYIGELEAGLGERERSLQELKRRVEELESGSRELGSGGEREGRKRGRG